MPDRAGKDEYQKAVIRGSGSSGGGINEEILAVRYSAVTALSERRSVCSRIVESTSVYPDDVCTSVSLA